VDTGVSVEVTGQTVVEISMVTVVTLPTGQSVTVGAQEVIVLVIVVLTVEVVYSTELEVGVM